MNDLKAPDCSGKGGNCNSCAQIINEQKNKGSDYDSHANSCGGIQNGCSIKGDPPPSAPSGNAITFGVPKRYQWITWLSDLSCQNAYATTGQKGSSDLGNSSSSAAAACEKNVATESRAAAKVASDCVKAIKDACSGVEDKNVDDAKKACKDAQKEADKAAKEADAKAGEAQKNADKNADNAKKEGGGMPQMPQIPQMPQDQAQNSQPDTSMNTNPSVTSATSSTPQTESDKLTENNPSGGSSVGFGLATSTNTATSTTSGGGNFGGGSMPFPSPASHFGDNSLGGGGSSPGFGSMGGGSSGSGGGGTLNATGASQPEPAKAADGANPYEVGGGGGGKLGAPKGFKGGGDSESAAADAAKDSFKADLGGAADPSRDLASDKAEGEDPEAGFTVFKMVKVRYVELKKRGAI
ncbi:MAG: hypothetical protein ACXVCK_11185 [Bdellovibrionota bacterium]